MRTNQPKDYGLKAHTLNLAYNDCILLGVNLYIYICVFIFVAVFLEPLPAYGVRASVCVRACVFVCNEEINTAADHSTFCSQQITLGHCYSAR